MTVINPNGTSRFHGSRLLACILLLPILAGSCGGMIPGGTPTPTLMPTASRTPSPTLTQTPTPTLTPTPTEPPVLCGGPPSMSILLVGSDARRDSYAAGLADSIRLVRVDFIQPRAHLLAFHRDLYVEIPGIESHNGITHGKLNQAYLYGNPGYDYFDGPGDGPGLLALTLEHNFDVQVDHYVAVNLQSFVRMVDALGGIDIDLPYLIDGRVPGSKDPNLYFTAGPQHLNGYRTMLLARLRPRGDLQRVEVQNLIMQSLADELLSLSVIRELPKLIEAFGDSVQTDLGPAEIGQLLCISTMLDADRIDFFSFPDALLKSERVRDPVLGNTSVLTADFELLKIYVQRFSDGNWPPSSQDPRDRIKP